jgi:hypothetical protein
MQTYNFLKNKKRLIGIYDFSYAPYALGDAFTWQINISIKAIERGLDNVVQCLVVDSMKPSCHLQTFITQANYRDYIVNLFPAFLCCPLDNSIKIFTNRKDFNFYFSNNFIQHNYLWPGFMEHAMERLDFYSHKTINDFFTKNNYIPRFKVPKGYEVSMDNFLNKYCNSRFLVSVNIRQRANYINLGFEKGALNHDRRDSPQAEWYRFFKLVHRKYPNVLFLILGGYSEWEKELYSYENVLIPRAMGYNLAHELTLFHKSDLFMGTSSGFSAFATFSEKPYIITNFDHAAAKYVDLPIGASSYPFALKNQILSWEKETTELLLELFETIHNSLMVK